MWGTIIDGFISIGAGLVACYYGNVDQSARYKDCYVGRKPTGLGAQEGCL